MIRQELTKLDRILWIALIAANVAFWTGVIGYALSAAFDHFALGAVL
jgi:hypothetical protein